MFARTWIVVRCWLVVFCLAFAESQCQAQVAAEHAEFFESQIRPLLVKHCYRCHAGETKAPKGGLRVDSAPALFAGGETGPAIVPGKPELGTFLEALRYQNPDLQMPPAGKLTDAEIAKLERWIRAGAPWPGSNDDATTALAQKQTLYEQFDLAARKASHWCWQPVANPPIPSARSATERTTPIDQFLLVELEKRNLNFAPLAPPEVLLRRISFALTGLPPTIEERAEFLEDRSPQALERLIDRYLASPHFGERWARHWLDLVRYAETRGHEFDYDIPNIYHYRDYVIDAFNDDLPYDQFVLEHLAGDCLPRPRRGPNGENRSVVGTAFWHLGEEVHSPIDLRQDQADRFDNRIDVFSKTFLALTISCARCHDHKFDAISAKDYYSLFAVLEGANYRQARFDTMLQEQTTAARWQQLHKQFTKSLPPFEPPPRNTNWLGDAKLIIDYNDYTPTGDETDGPGLCHHPSGSYQLRTQSDSVIAEPIGYGAFLYQPFWDILTIADGQALDGHALNKLPRAGRTLRTPRFTLEANSVFLLIRGEGMVYAPIHDHKIIQGPLHGELVKDFSAGAEYRWLELPLRGYVGKSFHLEVTAKSNSPFSFGIMAIVQGNTAPPAPVEKQLALVTLPSEHAAAWREAEAELRDGKTWQSKLVPALWDGEPTDEQVFVRGNPRTLGEEAPRRGPEALFGPQRLQHVRGSGRYELALQIIDPVQNPLFDRVMVNRLWHHLFGRGIVASTDNFGVLGEAPSHPALLDYLAQEFARNGRRIKPFLKRLMLTQAYTQSTRPNLDPADPTNEWLHSFRLKQLEGESLRDAILRTSQQLDPTLGGPSVLIHLTPFLDGRGRPASGPIDGRNRRSLYLAVRRNFLSPFLLSFDTPAPFSTVGRRQTSNVPAQALMLMNDPFVWQKATDWGKQLTTSSGSVAEKIEQVYLAAFSRRPNDAEMARAKQFLGSQPNSNAWTDFAHAIYQMKEFRFLK